MSAGSNFYTVLEVAHGASATEIKKSYRRLVRAFHPDANSAPEAAAHFRDIQSAYDTLSDPAKRRAYDRTLLQSGMYTAIGKEPALSPEQILRQAEDLLRYLQQNAGTGINFDALADFLMGILAPECILVLTRKQDSDINSRIVTTLLDAAERIVAVRAFSEIAARMQQLQPALSDELVQRIDRELADRVAKERQHRLVPIAALIMIAFFTLLTFFLVHRN